MLQWIQHFLQARRIRRVTAAQAQARVERGAAYLDEIDPGWYRRIDPDTLELSSGRACVLGQLHGEFRRGLSRTHLLDLSSAPRANLSPVAYGFRCVQGVPNDVQDQDYALLNQAWHTAIRERRTADRAALTPPTRADDRQHHQPARPSRLAEPMPTA